MADRALANAQKRRDDVASRINQLVQDLELARKELVLVETFIKEWHRFADVEAASVSHQQKDAGYPQGSLAIDTQVAPYIPNRPPDSVTRKNPDRAEVGRHAWRIITDLNRPVSRQELFTELASRGVRIFGKDPEMVLSTMMWRMQGDFIRLPKFGYWRRDRAWPPAGYEPGSDTGPDAEDMELLTKNILDPGGMADVESDRD